MFAVAEGWLLLDIGWFVLFFNDRWVAMLLDYRRCCQRSVIGSVKKAWKSVFKIDTDSLHRYFESFFTMIPLHHFILPRITDDGLISKTTVWSILLIRSVARRCIKLAWVQKRYRMMRHWPWSSFYFDKSKLYFTGMYYQLYLSMRLSISFQKDEIYFHNFNCWLIFTRNNAMNYLFLGYSLLWYNLFTLL